MTSLIHTTPVEPLEDVQTLQDVLTRVAARKVTAEPERPIHTPKIIPVSPSQQQALKHVTRDLADTELPSERRALTSEEALHLIVLGKDIKSAEKTLKVTTAALKEAVFTHLDVRLEEDNEPDDLPVDKKAEHYLVKGELVVEEAGLRFCRDLSQGSPDLTAEHLLDLYEANRITRAQYLKATRQVRVVDEDGLMDVLRTDPTVLSAIEEVIEPGEVTAKFQIREVKNEQ